jgi:chromosome segregation ATPase
MSKPTDRTNAERQARHRAKQQDRIAHLERENERLRGLVDSSNAEIARVEQERDKLRLENGKLIRQGGSPEPRPTKPRRGVKK